MKKKHLVTLVRIIKDNLYAYRKADWESKDVVETVSELITKKFANYMKEQEGLERIGKTEEDFLTTKRIEPMNIATLAGHLAFGLIAFSFLVKDIFWLRILSIAASLFSVFYNYVIPAEPMWLAINWNFVFIAVNIYHIGVILYEKREVKMDDKNQELYDTLFKEMTPVEYLKISIG